MYKILLMNTFEAFDDFDHDFDGFFQRESFAWDFRLIGQQVADLAILHHNYDEIRG
jgi:hypothetical protein